MSAAYNDGTVQYGSRVATVKDGASATYDTYVCDGFNMQRPCTPIEATTELGEPRGSVGVNKFIRGSLVGLNLASSSTKEPLNGHTITVTLDTTIGAETFFLLNVSRAESKESEKKFNADLIKKYN